MACLRSQLSIKSWNSSQYIEEPSRMPHGKQAKMLTPKQETAVLTYLQTRRYPARDRVMFLLSIKAGLRAKEIARLTWAMVTDAAGQVAEVIALPNRASKGRRGGRLIPLNNLLRAALVVWHQSH